MNESPHGLPGIQKNFSWIKGHYSNACRQRFASFCAYSLSLGVRTFSEERFLGGMPIKRCLEVHASLVRNRRIRLIGKLSPCASMTLLRKLNMENRI